MKKRFRECLVLGAVLALFNVAGFLLADSRPGPCCCIQYEGGGHGCVWDCDKCPQDAPEGAELMIPCYDPNGALCLNRRDSEQRECMCGDEA